MIDGITDAHTFIGYDSKVCPFFYSLVKDSGSLSWEASNNKMWSRNQKFIIPETHMVEQINPFVNIGCDSGSFRSVSYCTQNKKEKSPRYVRCSSHHLPWVGNSCILMLHMLWCRLKPKYEVRVSGKLKTGVFTPAPIQGYRSSCAKELPAFGNSGFLLQPFCKLDREHVKCRQIISYESQIFWYVRR